MLQVSVKGLKTLATVVGQSAPTHVGEDVYCKGHFIHDVKHGLQFKAKEIQIKAPTTLSGIEKYLGSGLIKGIGPHFSKKLITAFGETLFEIIEQHPEKLLTVSGFGKKRQSSLLSSWAEQKTIHEIMVFLQSHGVGTARAVRIYKTYGSNTVATLRSNPYCLAEDIRGIGFKTADTLALALGFEMTSMIRAQAGIRHVLKSLCEQGHCAIPKDTLINLSTTRLNIPETTLLQALASACQDETIIEAMVQKQQVFYPAVLYHAEQAIAYHLRRLENGKLPWGKLAIDTAIEWVQQKTKLQLAPSQDQAIRLLLDHKVSVLTGGPGVGKTTVLKSLLTIILQKKVRISLAAPTGRAAKRLSETTGLAAKTLHRLLEYQPNNHRFKFNAENPLPTDLLVVDEASMIDVRLMQALLKAMPQYASLILVGDHDQLPPVGPGCVLHDIIQSKTIPVAKLTDIFRQAACSAIITNAHRINQGQMPLALTEKDRASGQLSDFYCLYLPSAEAILEKLQTIVIDRLPKRFKFHPIRDVQVLSPMKRGPLGTQYLNLCLQKQLNPQTGPKLSRFGWTYFSGDKVMQHVNNYDKEVFNGDLGIVHHVDLENNCLDIRFDERMVRYQAHELDELSLAYAISIHKSQGSEYPAVVIPVSMQHYNLLAKNLIYTAVTRGRHLVVVLTEKKAMAMAVHQSQAKERLTNLTEILRQAPRAQLD